MKVASDPQIAIDALVREHHLVLSRPRDAWRPPGPNTPVYGYIDGLPRSQGKMLCTNGIDAWVLLGDDTLFKVHLQWWLPLVEDVGSEAPRNPSRSRKPKRKVIGYYV